MKTTVPAQFMGLSYCEKPDEIIDNLDALNQLLRWLTFFLNQRPCTALRLVSSTAFCLKESSSIILVTSAVQPV